MNVSRLGGVHWVSFLFIYLFLVFNIHFHKILSSKFSPHLLPLPTLKHRAFWLPFPSICPPFYHTPPFFYPYLLSFLVGQDRFLYPITCISYFPVVCKNNSQHLFLILWIPTSLPFSLPIHAHWKGKQFNIGYICVVLQKTSIKVMLWKTNYISLYPILPLISSIPSFDLVPPQKCLLLTASFSHLLSLPSPPYPTYPLLPYFPLV